MTKETTKRAAAKAKAKAKAKTKPATSTAPAPDPTADPRVSTLLAALGADPKLAPVVRDFEARKKAGGRAFGSNGLKVKSKLFALFTQGTLVVKLPKSRVAELAAAKQGEPFDPGHGRLMKEWLTVTGAKTPWLDLAREAHAFVNGAR
jgi:hypothetical protein